MALHTVRVWDLPTRLFHWLLLVCVAGLFASAYIPGTPPELHPRLGYAVLTLLLFRLVWGVFGGHWSRFRNFQLRPSSIGHYLRNRRQPPQGLGHNPLGAWAVVAMLLALAAQVGTGLVSDDEIGFIGPLNHWVSTAWGLAATSWHRGWGQWLIVGLVALHVGAIVFYRLVRRDDLVGPMLHGDKRVPGPAIASRDTAGVRLLALALLVLCGAGVYLLVRPVPGL